MFKAEPRVTLISCLCDKNLRIIYGAGKFFLAYVTSVSAPISGAGKFYITAPGKTGRVR